MELVVLDLRHRLYSELLRLSVTRAGHANERVITVSTTDGKPACCTDGSKCGQKAVATVVAK